MKMKKNSIIQVVILFSAFVLLLSCKKYDSEFYGPPMGLAPKDFNVTNFTISDTFPNFLLKKIYFKADFNATVRWKLVLKGQSSGAIKVFTDVSKYIDSTNAMWDGSTDTTRLFLRNEKVSVQLSVLGWRDTLKKTLTIAFEKRRGILLGSFENITINHPAKNFQDQTGYWWFYSFDSPAEFDTVNRVSDPGTPHGKHVLKFSGKDANQNYYIGKVGLSSPGPYFNFGTSDPNQLYFNIYVKGSGTNLSASGKPKDYKLVIETFEDDAGDGLQYNSTEDKFYYTISLNYDGWKLHRIKYSSFSLDPGSTASPYKNHSPDRIGNIGLYIGANTSAGLSKTDIIETAIDYFTITNNGPMIP
jgi:hypothetical protein